MARTIRLLPILLCCYFSTQAQSGTLDTLDAVSPNRVNTVLITTGSVYTVSLVGLSTIWYEDLGKFHFFNDNDGWRYMDKWGHAMTSYYVGRVGIEAFRWSGLADRKALWYGGSIGLLFLTSVEILDGMSEDWGFSIGDVAFNVGGAALAIGQELLWQDQRITLKWSFQPSPYAQYRPELLGRDHTTQWLKDYNGQTYWMSFNLKSFLPKAALPKWLNFAIGYGANGMTGANRNPLQNESGQEIPPFKRYSQFYLGPDIDLSKIKTKSKVLNFIFKGIGFVKVPLPAIEMRPGDRTKFLLFGF